MLYNMYIEGSCVGGKTASNRPGGYAYSVYNRNYMRIIEDGGCIEKATSNKMKLIAICSGLNDLIIKLKSQSDEPSLHDCVVMIDPGYVFECYSTYMEDWRENGWKKSNGDPIANKELWQELNRLIPEFKSFNFKLYYTHYSDWYRKHTSRMATEFTREAKARFKQT